jgi:hypothetical protein
MVVFSRRDFGPCGGALSQPASKTAHTVNPIANSFMNLPLGFNRRLQNGAFLLIPKKPSASAGVSHDSFKCQPPRNQNDRSPETRKFLQRLAVRAPAARDGGHHSYIRMLSL